MDTLIKRRGFVWYATASVILAFALEASFYSGLWGPTVPDTRPFWLTLINLHGSIVGLLLIGGAIAHAWRRKRPKWAVLMFFVWPLAFVYAFLVDSPWVNE